MIFVQNVSSEATSLQEIRDKTKNDITLQKVISEMQNKKCRNKYRKQRT